MGQHWIRLSVWARDHGVSKMSAWRLARDGKIPGARMNEMGRWMVPAPPPASPAVVSRTVAYARVSGHDQKADLDRQVARIAEWAAVQGMVVNAYVREIGSGLNERRARLHEILADPEVTTIVVEHRDRLARFGVRHLETALKTTGRRLLVIEERETDDDLVQDMIDLITCFSARLHGRRSARTRAARAVAQLQQPSP